MEAKEIRSLIILAGFSFRKKRKSESDGEYQGNFDKAALRVYRMLTDLPNKHLVPMMSQEKAEEILASCGINKPTQNTAHNLHQEMMEEMLPDSLRSNT